MNQCITPNPAWFDGISRSTLALAAATVIFAYQEEIGERRVNSYYLI